jgi:DNA polymerase-3 subunit epsilon
MSSADGIPLTTFSTAEESRDFIDRLIEDFNLCQTLCGLYTSGLACFHYEIKKCFGACVDEESADSYNLRVQKAINSIGLASKSFLLFDKGRNDSEKSVVKVINGKLIGYGFFDPNSIDGNLWLIDDIITHCSDNRDAHQIIKSFLTKAKPSNVIFFNDHLMEENL